MFSRKERFPRALFPSAIKTGRRFSSPHLSILVPDKKILPPGMNGYAVIVPKKIARLSVRRHQIKRRVLSALRNLLSAGQTLPPSLIVFPHSSASSVNYHDIKIELADLLSTINYSNKPIP